MRTKPLFEPHLAINEVRVPKGGEWLPHFRGWCLSRTGSGISYWQEQNGTREIPAGSTLVFSAEAGGVLRASQLNEVAVTYFCVETENLLGLLSLREHHYLKQAASRKSLAVRVFSPASPISERLKHLHLNPGASSSSMRLRLLQLFMDVF